MDLINDWLFFPHSLYDVLIISLYAAGTALVILLVKKFFREQLSARWHLYIWGVLIARMVIRPERLTWKSSFSLSRLIQPEGLAAGIRFAMDRHRMGIGSAEGAVNGGLDLGAGTGPGAVSEAVGSVGSAAEGMSFLGQGSPEWYDVPVETFLGPLNLENAFQMTAVKVYWIGVAVAALLFLLM